MIWLLPTHYTHVQRLNNPLTQHMCLLSVLWTLPGFSSPYRLAICYFLWLDWYFLFFFLAMLLPLLPSNVNLNVSLSETFTEHQIWVSPWIFLFFSFFIASHFLYTISNNLLYRYIFHIPVRSKRMGAHLLYSMLNAENWEL